MTSYTNPTQPTGDGHEGGPTEAETDDTVELVSEERLSLSWRDLERFPTVDRECTVVCASGDRTTATWTGVPVSTLVSHADAPPETTHLCVASDDGYRACVELADALGGLLAVARDGDPLAAVEQYDTRFVGPDVSGERSAKGVVEIEFVAVDADEDPSDLETLSLDDPTYG